MEHIFGSNAAEEVAYYKAYEVYQAAKLKFLAWALPEQESLHDVENLNQKYVHEIDIKYYATPNGVRGHLIGTGSLFDGNTQFYKMPDSAPELTWEPSGLVKTEGCKK